MTVTLITGTSKGIGQTTALHLARQGHHVMALGRPASRWEGNAVKKVTKGLIFGALAHEMSKNEFAGMKRSNS